MRRARRKKSRPSVASNYRVNRQIRAREVQLIDHTGQNRGIVPTREAYEIAQDAQLDLVEVAPNARPPVCRVLDFGKFAYEKTRKDREARKQQKKIEIKTIQLSIDTADFHRDIKIRKAKKWLSEGKKVKVSIRFFGREITRPELGQEVMTSIEEELSEFGVVEQKPNLEGRKMIMLLTPES